MTDFEILNSEYNDIVTSVKATLDILNTDYTVENHQPPFTSVFIVDDFFVVVVKPYNEKIDRVDCVDSNFVIDIYSHKSYDTLEMSIACNYDFIYTMVIYRLFKHNLKH